MPKISEYPAVTPTSGDEFVLARGGKNYKADFSDMLSGGLTNIEIAPTDSNITLTANYRHFVDASGLTADRALLFPAASAGDLISVRTIDDHADYACGMQGDAGVGLEGLVGVEWDRLWNARMNLDFVYRAADGWRCIGDNRTHWRKILLTGTESEIDVTNIPPNKHTIESDYLLRTNRSGQTYDTLRMQCNGDTGAKYYTMLPALWHNANYVTSEEIAATSWWAQTIAGNTAPAGVYGFGKIIIPAYTNETAQKSFQARGGTILALSTTNLRFYDSLGHWAPTSVAAINRLRFFSGNGANFVAGCSLIITLK